MKKGDMTMAHIVGVIILLVLLVWALIWFISLRNQGQTILGGIFG